MSIRKILAWGLLLIMMMSARTMAEETLAAALKGGVLDIRWNAEGRCVLTVYRDGWPMAVNWVDGESGGTTVDIGGRSGAYSVRLKTETGCLTAEVGKTVLPTIAPAIAEPTAVPTQTPMLTASPVATVQPSPVLTAVPDLGGQSVTSLAAQVVSEVNAERAKAGLRPLSVSAELTGAACVRAKEIVELFSHTRPDGRAWSTVSSSAYGENIAKGHNSAAHVMAAWMTSDGHRANIMKASYGSIGVCAWRVDGVIYWVQLFGK